MNNNKYKLLLIEDEENIHNFVTALLEANGYQVIGAKTCAEGTMLFSSHCPDLVILDLGLPDGDGMEFLREIRRGSVVPVIVLSARTNEADKVQALDLGANDYVTKPFGSAELLARVRSAMRNFRYSVHSGAGGNRYESQGLVIDYDARRVFCQGTEIKFTQIEYNILAFLSAHPGKVMTYAAIIKVIWGYNDLGSRKKLQVNMANIRKKLGAKPGEISHIVNELGVGYRMLRSDEE